MNYRKIIKSAVYAHQEHNLTSFAWIAGLAAGAAIAVLFAPRSGRESRKLLAKRFSSSEDQDHHQLKDGAIDDIRETVRTHADQLQGPENKRKNPSEIKFSSITTTAWKKNTFKD